MICTRTGNKIVAETRLGAILSKQQSLMKKVPDECEECKSWAAWASMPCRQPETLLFFIRLLLLEKQKP